MIEYYNYLTTPSGKSFSIKELRNREYLVLLKFLNGDNYKGFYKALDTLIKESIDCFDTLDICDKAYIYIAYYFYSVRGSISLKGQKVDSVEVPLTIMLDSIENSYKKSHITFKLNNYDVEIHYPTKLLFDDNESFIIDKFSALRSFGGNPIDSIALEQLREVIPTKFINEIEYQTDKNFDTEIVINEAGPNSNKIADNILRPSMFYSIAFIYKDMLENFYNMQYLITHYIRVSWESLLDMTPIETTILYKNFIDDKEKQNEKAKSSKSNYINVNDPNVADTLMPY